MHEFIYPPFVLIGSAQVAQVQLTTSDVSDLIKVKGAAAALQQIYEDERRGLSFFTESQRARKAG